MSSHGEIRLNSLVLSRGEGRHRRQVLEGVSTGFATGVISSIVGRSGTGKSTLLGVLAGMLKPDSGTVSLPQNSPRVGMVFQSDDALFHWRSVARNLGYAAEIAGRSREEQRSAAERLCRLVGLDPGHVMARLPGTLSGGERRRLGVGLALAADPEVLLADEATSNLDWLIRRQMQHMLQNLWMQRRMTVIAVTHDVEEAVFLSRAVKIMKSHGELEEFIVPFSYPRTDEMRADPIFTRLVSEIAGRLADTEAKRKA